MRPSATPSRPGPDYYYLIVSCIGGEVKEGKVFSRSDWETRQMTEEPLEVLGA